MTVRAEGAAAILAVLSLPVPAGSASAQVTATTEPDLVRPAQRLIELGKENREMAVYPVEWHGFVEPSSWTDEFRSIFELFERSIGGSR